MIKAPAAQKPYSYNVTLPGWPGLAWVGPFTPQGSLELGIHYRHGLAGVLNAGDTNLGAISNYYFLLHTLGSFKSAVREIKRKYEMRRKALGTWKEERYEQVLCSI